MKNKEEGKKAKKDKRAMNKKVKVKNNKKLIPLRRPRRFNRIPSCATDLSALETLKSPADSSALETEEEGAEEEEEEKGAHNVP
jgi:hypothetical protein